MFSSAAACVCLCRFSMQGAWCRALWQRQLIVCKLGKRLVACPHQYAAAAPWGLAAGCPSACLCLHCAGVGTAAVISST